MGWHLHDWIKIHLYRTYVRTGNTGIKRIEWNSMYSQYCQQPYSCPRSDFPCADVAEAPSSRPVSRDVTQIKPLVAILLCNELWILPTSIRPPFHPSPAPATRMKEAEAVPYNMVALPFSIVIRVTASTKNSILWHLQWLRMKLMAEADPCSDSITIMTQSVSCIVEMMSTVDDRLSVYI